MRALKKTWAIAILVAFVFFMFYEPVVCGIILGLIFIVIGVRGWKFIYRMNNNGIKRWGTVVSFETDNESGNIPIIEYDTLENESITAQPHFYAYASVTKIRNPKKHIGKRTIILYDPDNVKRFVLKADLGFYTFIAVIGTFVGLGFTIMATLSLLGLIG